MCVHIIYFILYIHVYRCAYFILYIHVYICVGSVLGTINQQDGLDLHRDYTKFWTSV